MPVVAETSGGWGASAMSLWNGMIKSKACGTDADDESKWRLRKHLDYTCTAIRRANARAVLRRAQGEPADASASAAAHAAAMCILSND